jgi:hypothetical protein
VPTTSATARRSRRRASRSRRRPREVSPRIRRRRLGALLGIALITALIGLSVALVSRGKGERPPATGAAAVVPADALAYLHLSTDPTRPGVKRALSLLSRFPDYPRLTATLLGRLSAVLGGSASGGFGQAVVPWLGREAAFAVLTTPTASAGTLLVLDVRNRLGAQTFLNTTGAMPDGSYDGVGLLRSASGTEYAFVRHYLAAGQPDSVRAALDAASGRVSALRSNRDYRRAAAGEPNGRVLDSYISAAGMRRLLTPGSGIVGALGALLYQPALAGTTISLSAVSGGARVRVHSALDPSLVRLSGPRPTAFSPSLAREFPSGSALLFDLTALDRVAPRVLGAGTAAGIGGSVAPLLRRLGGALQSEGVDVHSVLSLFHDESAVALAPTPNAPTLLIVARTRHESSTRDTLAALQAPLAQLFPPPASGPGQATGWGDRQIAGVTAHQLRLAPGLQLNYAVFRGMLVVSTSLAGIGEVAQHSRSLAGDAAYKTALAGRPDRVTSLLFLDFSQLLALGEQTGLTRSTRFRAMRADLEKVRAVGLDSTSGEADTTAELFLQIS